jgi:hypothetical protein
LIGFISHPNGPFFSGQGLGWFYIADPGGAPDPFPEGLTGSDFAFSPDSRSMVFFGCEHGGAACGVYAYAFETLQKRKILEVTAADFFVWSPDGQYLAFVGAERNSSLQLLVIRTFTGEIVYRHGYDWKLSQAPPESLVAAWGVTFPPQATGLEACAWPPAAP